MPPRQGHNKSQNGDNPIPVNPDLSLHFNSHFPGGPGLASTVMSRFRILLELRVMGGGAINLSYKMGKSLVQFG